MSERTKIRWLPLMTRGSRFLFAVFGRRFFCQPSGLVASVGATRFRCLSPFAPLEYRIALLAISSVRKTVGWSFKSSFASVRFGVSGNFRQYSFEMSCLVMLRLRIQVQLSPSGKASLNLVGSCTLVALHKADDLFVS